MTTWPRTRRLAVAPALLAARPTQARPGTPVTTVRAARGFVIGAASEATRVRDQYGVAADRIAAIANPLDPETVKRQPRASARAALGIDPAARVVVWVGRVDVKPKGLDTLLDAWSAVRESRPGPLLLLMLGTGSGATWLHDRIAELGLDDVRWRDEYVLDRGVVGQYLSAADVFVLPSRQEGFPVALRPQRRVHLEIRVVGRPGGQRWTPDEQTEATSSTRSRPAGHAPRSHPGAPR